MCNPIGVRKAPTPNGRAGWVRIDSVHQGDLDGIKGVYHITCVDAVSQWQVQATAISFGAGWTPVSNVTIDLAYSYLWEDSTKVNDSSASKGAYSSTYKNSASGTVLRSPIVSDLRDVRYRECNAHLASKQHHASHPCSVKAPQAARPRQRQTLPGHCSAG